jgi:hypothetical protein
MQLTEYKDSAKNMQITLPSAYFASGVFLMWLKFIRAGVTREPCLPTLYINLSYGCSGSRIVFRLEYFSLDSILNFPSFVIRLLKYS